MGILSYFLASIPNIKITRDWIFSLFFSPCLSLYFWGKPNSQFRGSNCQIKHLFKFRLLKGVGTFDRHIQGVVNFLCIFFLIDWRNRRQTNTTVMVIMVQPFRKAGCRHGVHGVGGSLQAASRSKKRKNSSVGDVEVCLAHVSHMLQAIHLRRYVIHANSKF